MVNPLGSRDEDPLLKNDPLAPSSDGDEGEGDDETTGMTSSGEDPSSANLPPGKTSSGLQRQSPQKNESDSELQEDNWSVFSPSEDHFAFGGEGDTRVVVRSVEAAAEGRLTVLNSAFDQGWRLARVALKEEKSSFSVAFVLRSPESP